MAEIPDLHLNRPANPGDSTGDDSLRDDFRGDTSFTDDVGDSSARTKWIILGVVFLIAAATIGYVLIRRTSPAAPQTTAVEQSPAATEVPVRPRQGGPLVEAEKIDLPPLPETDAVVRSLLVKLSSHPKVMAWLATNGLIENFTVATLNLSEGKTPVSHWPGLGPKERFSVTKTASGPRLDPKSYRRYDVYAAAIGGLDPAGTARLYLTLKPRIIDAYRNLGFPEGDFDPVLERAMANLLATQPIAGDIALKEKVLSFGYADPDIEALPSAQRQLLRLGPDNMRIVQNKLREIAVQLGLHPEPGRPSGTP